MLCPFCGAQATKVVDSRLAAAGDQVRRRRVCQHCDERFTTYETAELFLPRIVKRDGRREPFVIDKLRVGILRALEKRSVASETVEKTLSQLQHRLRTCGDREVPSARLGEWVMEALGRLDPVAYVRFASVYRSFNDLEAFRDVIDTLAVTNETHCQQETSSTDHE